MKNPVQKMKKIIFKLEKKYLQTTYTTKVWSLEYIKNFLNSTFEKLTIR